MKIYRVILVVAVLCLAASADTLVYDHTFAPRYGGNWQDYTTYTAFTLTGPTVVTGLGIDLAFGGGSYVPGIPITWTILSDSPLINTGSYDPHAAFNPAALLLATGASPGGAMTGYSMMMGLPDITLGPGTYWVGLHSYSGYWGGDYRGGLVQSVNWSGIHDDLGPFQVNSPGADVSFRVYGHDAVPEPISLILFGSGLAAAFTERRKKRN